MRIALLSSPRAGNTWLRSLIADLYSLDPIAAHSPGDIDWGNLPERSIIQIHWHATTELLNLLEEQSIQALSICRHPLDILISILHFAPYESQTRFWLMGEGGTEEKIIDQDPTSIHFLEYGCGTRANALLSVSAEWLRVRDVIAVRYEELVEDTAKILEELVAHFGNPKTPIKDVVAARSLEESRKTSSNQHFWRGRPGSWRKVITHEFASKIYAAQEEVFSCLGYKCDADKSLSPQQAKATWDSIS